MTTTAQFKIEYSQYLDPKGKLLCDLPFEKSKLVQFYRTMVLIRLFDNKAIALQRTGKLGTYASSLGQEAIGVAIGSALKKNDVYCPAYREYGAMFLRGVNLSKILSYWGGDERGSVFGGDSIADTPICVPIATQCLHAAGIARAQQIRKQKRATLVVCGDGAASKGDFLEAINVAGAWKLPLVMIINNNQWAISVPRKNQAGGETLAQKGLLGGLSCEQVDGNDIVALYKSIDTALEKARSGKGPHLIEAITYRLCDHTTADDASRYREDAEVKKAWEEEPIKRLKLYLESEKLWDAKQEETLQSFCADEVEKIVAEYEEAELQPVTSMFDYLYAELPAALNEQRESALAFAEINDA